MRNNAAGIPVYNTSSLSRVSKDGSTHATAQQNAGINSTLYRGTTTISENWHGSRLKTIITRVLRIVFHGEKFVEGKLCLTVKMMLV